MDIATLKNAVKTARNSVSVFFVENIFKMFETLNAYTDTVAENRYRFYCDGSIYECSLVRTKSGHFLKVRGV